MLYKVTIVIPTYNGEKYIRETIESCLRQSYGNIRIVVVNDCSTDETLKILNDFSGRIKIISNLKNQGLPKNINQIILNDDSDFFIYLGHDDILPENHVEIMIGEFNSEEIAAVYCNSVVINKDGDRSYYTKNNILQVKKNNDMMYQLSLNNFISIIGMMHRTSVFKKIYGWDEEYDLYGEWLYYIRVLGVGRINYSQNTYALYRKHSDNASGKLHINTHKIKEFYRYKTRCRVLAYKNSELTLFKKFMYFSNLLRHHLIYKKILYKGVWYEATNSK
jgi:glycosyltransferase involved in cell wall biosynthesis